jgi:hypothetical protein
MKRMFWVIGGLVLMVGVVVVLVLSSCGGQENMATVVEAVNKVDAHSRPRGDWQPATVGMTVYSGGQVRTGEVSWVCLELLEGAVRLSADSVFTLKESVTRRGKLVTTLLLQEGRLWVHLTTDQLHDFTIETGNAVAAVRDTRFSIKVTGDVTLVSVAEGEVTLTAQGRMVTISAGEQATVENSQPPSLPEPISDEERALWATQGNMPELAPPAPTSTLTETPTFTSSPTHTLTPSPTPTSTETSMPTPTCTCTPTLSPMPTSTSTNTPTPTATPTREPTPTPTNTPVKISMKCDVNSYIWGPTRDPASGYPETVIMGTIEDVRATQVAIKFPNEEIVVLPLGGVFAWPERSFLGQFPGLPQAGGTYVCTFLDTDGAAIPGAVTSDVYLGGYETDPPANFRAEVVEAGVLATWDPSPVIPGAFDPTASPPLGHYHIGVAEEGGGSVYTWNPLGPLLETSHLIPFRSQDFDPGGRGLALGEWGDGVYGLCIHAASDAPEGSAGQGLDGAVRNPADDWLIVIEGGQVQVEKP